MNAAGSGLAQPAALLAGALRSGDLAAAVAVLEPLDPAARRRLPARLRTTARELLAAPVAAREPAWDGPLRPGHHQVAECVLLATSPLARATGLWPLDFAVARDVLPRLLPDDLPAFVTRWSDQFRADPKAWDRNAGRAAMFDWAHAGLVPPPVEDGAVLMLVTGVPGTGDGAQLLRYLEERPVLITTTFARLFDVPGVKGASPAQRDQTTYGRRLDDHVVPALVRRGWWSADQVRDGVRRALAAGLPAYQERWFRGLEQHLP
ncbi:hypothetical protein DNL40_08275 [Xylanimonas oleitrophica]|uniref:Uncharacterized protein n=1 Tax=Xylanimonas oleitrophica TaxID=2607479 RepID=A0A2W5XTP8_9MICO|nr:hypothetical protein [Xylanimonas oleitrophica]PZR53488.1 hypothetical protein DNL40_08275 [Xylanimonas oleitrophica]